MKRYRQVDTCMNCLRKTSKCDCVATLTHIQSVCQNCELPIEIEWFYCPKCGSNINVMRNIEGVNE